MTEEEQTFGIPPQETTADDTGIPDQAAGIQAGIPNMSSGIPDDKATTAKVKTSTKTLVTALKTGDESFDDTVRRVFGVYSDMTSRIEHLRAANNEIREDLRVELERHQAKFDEQVLEIGGLRAEIATLTNQIETTLVPAAGQATLSSFGIKDTVNEARDICGDDDTCMKVAAKMLDMKAHFASKAMDNDHNAEQKRLDREQTELDRKSKQEMAAKDRALKESLAEKEHQNKIELQLAKKGGFRNGFLDDIVFIGGGSTKRPGKVIADKRKRAFHAAASEEDDSWLNDSPADEEELMMHDDFDESQI